ncbi:MAG TPA: hypothetical protein VF691_15955, partial [Cytophagaceae bacterium]
MNGYNSLQNYRQAKILMSFLLTWMAFTYCPAQCDNPIINAPTPQMGALMDAQFINLWRQAGGNDKYGAYFKEESTVSIGDDGWPIEGKAHAIRFYPAAITPLIQKNDVIKFKFKGLISQLTHPGLAFWENCFYQNITQVGNYVTADIRVVNNYPVNGEGTNGIQFSFYGHIEDVQIVRPGFDYDDPRLLTDDYVQHVKSAGWRSTRMSFIMGVNANSDQTWAKRLSKNAPCHINIWQTGPGRLANQEIWAFDKSNGANENNVPGHNGATGRMRGSPWEVQIDICNELNIDLWACLPVLVDDDYVKNLA